MRPPEIIYRRAQRPSPQRDEAPAVPAPAPAAVPAPRAPPRWRGLAGQVAGEFRAYGGRVWTNDDLTNAKNERRLPNG